MARVHRQPVLRFSAIPFRPRVLVYDYVHKLRSVCPRNPTVLAVLFVCAVSVSSALFLVLELDLPFEGLIKVSSDPLRYAHSHINQ